MASAILKTLGPILFCAYAVIIVSDTQLRKMERFEELVAKGQGINSPLADFIHRKYGATLAIKQVREDLEFEIEPRRRLQLWFELKDAHRTLNDTEGVIEVCEAWIAEYPHDPKTLMAYEDVVVHLQKTNQKEKLKTYLQKWADGLIAMGPETKLGDILKWWEFAHVNPRLVDEQPLLEKVSQDYSKHVPALGALISLQATYETQGKKEQAAAVARQVKLLSERASPIQRNQSERLAIQFLLNHAMWDQLQQRLVYTFASFPKSDDFNGLLRKTKARTLESLGPQKQLEFYKATAELALKTVPAAQQANNVPLGEWIGDYGMILAGQGNYGELSRISKILNSISPASSTAFQIERLLWLNDSSSPTRLPHADIKRAAPAPLVDGASADMCWFGEEYLLGELKPAGSAPNLTTKAWAAYDDEFFYMLVQAQEPETARIFQGQTGPGSHLVDSVEIFINSKKDYSSYRHASAGVDGSTYTATLTLPAGAPANAAPEVSAWPARMTAPITPAGTTWTCELKIPWADIGIKPRPGESFFFNVRRSRHARGTSDYYSWSPAGSQGHWVETFGIVVLK